MTVAESDSAPGAPRRALTRGLVALLVVAVAGLGAMVVRAAVISGDVPEVEATYPAGAILCRSALTSDCRSTASARAGFPVALLSDSDQRDFVLLAVVDDARQTRGHRAVAELKEGDAFVTVFSAPREQPAGRRVGEVESDAGNGELRVSERDGAARATVDWSRSSDLYRIEVYWPGGSTSEAERLARQSFQDVQFAD